MICILSGPLSEVGIASDGGAGVEGAEPEMVEAGEGTVGAVAVDMIRADLQECIAADAMILLMVASLTCMQVVRWR